jgi:hypothetical protein
MEMSEVMGQVSVVSYQFSVEQRIESSRLKVQGGSR